MGSYWAYATIGQRRVEGWVESPFFWVLRSLSDAQRARSVDGHITEIGVHHGRLFIAMHLLRAPGGRSLAIDLFDKQEANVEQSGAGSELALRRNLARYAGGADDVLFLAGDSREIDGDDVQKAVGGGVRLFSVDGGHEADIVHKDMQTAAESLVPGGIVIADDVFNPNWPGTAVGTMRYLDSDASLKPFAVGFNKVLFADADTADHYREVLAALARRRAWLLRTVAMGHYPVAVLSVPRRPKARVSLIGKRLLGA